jgi:hypothetical protein
MAELTWENITGNIKDALKEMQKLDRQISSGDMPDEVEFQIAMQHIYHHLNFAWNIRHEPIENYVGMTKDQFNLWGKFPEDLMW